MFYQVFLSLKCLDACMQPFKQKAIEKSFTAKLYIVVFLNADILYLLVSAIFFF